jgi:hypothetical protein
MPLLTSKYRSGLDNLSVDVSTVTRVQLKTPCQSSNSLWITYFWGMDATSKEKVIRTWFYKSESEWQAELKRIREKHPQLKID